jgi:hypothetical protein
MTLSEHIAAYVLKLEDCSRRTHRAGDRSVYQTYLADAAGILALSISDQSVASLKDRAQSHERLWGHSWLQDEVYREAADAWKLVKEELLRAAT